MKQDWHALPWKEVVRKLHSHPKLGLSEEEVKRRRRKFGENKLPGKKPPSKIFLFLNQFKSPLIGILLSAGLITLFLKETVDSLVIFAAVFLNALFGFWEELKVANVFLRLKKILKTKAVVQREGRKKEIFQEELVPGDIILLKAGDKIPADGRLIEAENLKVSEAILTGEWLPAEKKTDVLPKETPLFDRDNMVYAGCLVESGRGKAIVTATGKETESGKILGLIEEVVEEKTPLQKKLAQFGKTISLCILFAVLLIFLGGVWEKRNPLQMLETAIAIAVGGIPEALPIVITVILAVGMERILKKKGLVRKLGAIETLSSTSIICFDKTRTLTEGKMVPEEIVAPDKEQLLKAALLSTDAFIENPEDDPWKWKIRGSPTGKAIVRAGRKEGVLQPDLEKESKEIFSKPFDPNTKYQLSLRKEKDKLFLYISGAPERILEKSTNPLDWKERLEKLSQRGLRVIGVGFKEIKSPEKNLEKMAKNFVFLGLIGLKDPIRKDVKKALKTCLEAKIRPILITGDFRKTALAVAREIGFKVKEEEVMDGEELDKIPQKDWERTVEKIKIYARAEPRHKLKIVEAWQKKGEVVGMVGDGVNDAPALKKADIGISLGSGTEVAKEVSDLVLLNDSFSILIRAVEEGRTILDNIRKAISYVLADSFTSAILVGASILFKWPLPLLWPQILWNNIVEDTLPNIAYAFEPKEKGVMKRPPSSPKTPLLTSEMKALIFLTGLIDQFLALALFLFLWKFLKLPLDYVRTMVFGTICLDTAFVIYCYKSLRKNIWEINLFNNKFLLLSSIVVFLAFALAIYLPFLQNFLHTVPLGLKSWLVIIGTAIISMLLIEGTKWYFIIRKATD